MCWRSVHVNRLQKVFPCSLLLWNELLHGFDGRSVQDIRPWGHSACTLKQCAVLSVCVSSRRPLVQVSLEQGNSN